MKRIAVASKGSYITEALAEAEGFRIYEFDGTTIHVVDYFDTEDVSFEALPAHLKAFDVEEFFTGRIEAAQTDNYETSGIKVISTLKGEIADAVIGYYLEEILENKKRGMKPLSSCHSHGTND